MGSSKKADSPDYTGAAEATAEGNKEALMYQTDANRVNQITPWGNLSWHGKPGEAGYGQEIALSPNQQSIFNRQEQIQSQRQQNALGLGDRVQQEMNRPEDFYNNLPDVAGTPDVPTYGEGLTQFGQGGQQSTVQGQPNAEYQNLTQFGRAGQEGQVQQMQGSQYDPRFAQQAFDRQVSLIRPTHADQQERQEVQLRNQGLAPGTQAYDSALGSLRAQQGEEMNAISADAIDRGRSEQQAEFQRSMQAGSQRFGQENTRFGQQMQQANMADQQLQQQASEQGAQFQRQLAGGAQRFGQEGTRFQQQMAQGNMYDQQRQQQAAEQMQFGGQGFSQQMQQQNQQNKLRQQAIAEQQGRETSALNLQNAAQSGQQVSMPQMPSYNTAGYVGGPDYLGAAQMQGNFDTANQQPSIWETGGNLGAAYLGGGGKLPGGG